MILLVLSLFIGMKLNKALKSVLTIGIGFVGLGLIFGYFMETLSPVHNSS
jgi:galactitol-specific phosphotransferase system IIC component